MFPILECWRRPVRRYPKWLKIHRVYRPVEWRFLLGRRETESLPHFKWMPVGQPVG